MNIVTIIGTRPQYIKLKPFYDYCKKNNISNTIVDTNQHYSENVSSDLIRELGLEIDLNLAIYGDTEMDFISNGIRVMSDFFDSQRTDAKSVKQTVVVMGDTNSTLIAALVAKKKGYRVAHIEAGVRCYDSNSPEEINRLMVDSISDIHFTSRVKDNKNVSNPIYVGDLEYNFLNSIEDDQIFCISYDKSILLTIHRQENMTTERLNTIFEFCEKLKYPIIFPIHHRTAKFVKDHDIEIPMNISVVDPVGYLTIISMMRECRGIITDSGGITKTSPFFGKKVIVPMDKWEWDEVFTEGYATNKLDEEWFDQFRMNRKMDMYYVENSCEIIVNTILE